jgi:prophage tail gpP-like protein
MPDDVRLTVDGTEYLGWKNIRIERSIDTISGVFGLEVSDKWSAASASWPIKPGAVCALSIDGEVIITGYVDVVRASFDAKSRSLQISGRDKAADMIDSSALNDPDSWSNITLGKLAAELAAPFGIAVIDDAKDDKLFPLVKIQPGETAFEVLERYARQRGVLTISDGSGRIVLTKPGQRRADVSLVQGQNILRASGTADHSQRFSEYLVTGQTAGTDTVFGSEASEVEGKARDAEVRGARRLLIVAQNSVDAENMAAMAAWEASVRAARGSPLTVTVQGYHQTPAGRLWQPGEILQTQSPWLQLPQPVEFMINAVKFLKSDSDGTLTELELLRPDAYKAKPEVPDSNTQFGGYLDE